MQLGYVGIITNLQMVLNTLKKSLHVDQATQKNIWLHQHNSRGFHVRFYPVKQCLSPTTYFFTF